MFRLLEVCEIVLLALIAGYAGGWAAARGIVANLKSIEQRDAAADMVDRQP